MGNLCCVNRRNKKSIVLLLLGLDNAGKTVAVKNLAGEPVDTVVPTLGFSIVNLHYMDFDVKVFDLGGRHDIRDIWEQYYVYAHGLIYVIDASDYARLNEAQKALTNILAHEKIRGKPILVLANKQDHNDALDEIDLIERLQLEPVVNNYECPTLVESCSATEVTRKSKPDAGIKKGYNWIINYIKRDYNILNHRVEMDVELQEELDRNDREAKIERIRFLNEKERREAELEEEKMASVQPNGIQLSNVFVIKNNRLKHSDSDSSASTDSLPQVYYGTIQQEIIPERPRSSTKAVRQHLELDTIHSKQSFKITSNKTTPVHFIGTKLPQSAGERQKSSKSHDRRNLKSAGDNIFIVSNAPKLSIPIENGSGDLKSYDLRGAYTNNVLPPINDTNKLGNGFQAIENHL